MIEEVVCDPETRSRSTSVEHTSRIHALALSPSCPTEDSANGVKVGLPSCNDYRNQGPTLLRFCASLWRGIAPPSPARR